MYRKYDEYKQLQETLDAFCGIVLFSFAKDKCETKDLILRNTVARTSMSLKGIFAQWDIQNYQDGWSIYRNILDRFFHIEHIAQNKQFQEFDDWSVYQQAIKQNLIKSDDRFQNLVSQSLSPEMKSRIKKLLQNKPSWKRPKAKDVAKNMEMDFLYKYGYDMATMHTHLMSDDGEQDFYTITGLTSSKGFPDQMVLLHNSLLSLTLIIQSVFNYSSFRWMTIMYDFVEQLRDSLQSGNQDYGITFVKIAKAFDESLILCEKNA